MITRLRAAIMLRDYFGEEVAHYVSQKYACQLQSVLVKTSSPAMTLYDMGEECMTDHNWAQLFWMLFLIDPMSRSDKRVQRIILKTIDNHNSN